MDRLLKNLHKLRKLHRGYKTAKAGFDIVTGARDCYEAIRDGKETFEAFSEVQKENREDARIDAAIAEMLEKYTTG